MAGFELFNPEFYGLFSVWQLMHLHSPQVTKQIADAITPERSCQLYSQTNRSIFRCDHTSSARLIYSVTAILAKKLSVKKEHQ